MSSLEEMRAVIKALLPFSSKTRFLFLRHTVHNIHRYNTFLLISHVLSHVSSSQEQILTMLIIILPLSACLFPTCVVEEGGNKGAVLEEGVAGGDVLKVTLLKQRVLKHHRLHFQVHKPASS